MDYPLFTKLAAEFFGTAILMIFGNGSVANVELKNTKGHHAGWLNIAMGYGFGVMFPVLMFGSVSGAHINPAMTIAQAVNGLFPWNEVLPYIVAQLLGALLGQLIVYITYYPHYKETEDAEAILGTFCTTDADNQRPTTSSTRCSAPWCSSSALCCLSLAWGKQELRRRLHRRRLHCVGPRDLHGWPDRPWPEPGPRPHAASAARHPADPAQGLLPLGRGLDPGCGPDCRRHYRRLAVRVLLRQLIR